MGNFVTITSGTFRGRKIITPGGDTHPMGNRERLALFNSLGAILANRPSVSNNRSSNTPILDPVDHPSDTSSSGHPDSPFSGLRILDAYAGSGSLGFEALSRGATSVVFIERSPKVVSIIRQNAVNLGVLDQCQVVTKDVARVLSSSPPPKFLLTQNFWGSPSGDTTRATSLFDIVLVDPPYNHYNSSEFAHFAHFLAPGGLLALSSPTTPDPTLFRSYGLSVASTHKYASAHLTIFTKPQ